MKPYPLASLNHLILPLNRTCIPPCEWCPPEVLPPAAALPSRRGGRQQKTAMASPTSHRGCETRESNRVGMNRDHDQLRWSLAGVALPRSLKRTATYPTPPGLSSVFLAAHRPRGGAAGGTGLQVKPRGPGPHLGVYSAFSRGRDWPAGGTSPQRPSTSPARV